MVALIGLRLPRIRTKEKRISEIISVFTQVVYIDLNYPHSCVPVQCIHKLSKDVDG